MKNKLLVFGLTMLIGLLVACHSTNDDVNATFTGTIKEINGETALVFIEAGDILSSGDQVTIDLSIASDTTLNVGDQVRVGYDGTVRESYPLGINTTFVEKVK